MTALVNEAVARNSGGKFVVRFDDAHPMRLATIGKEKTDLISKGQREDLEWLGLIPDEWIKQSDVLAEIRDDLFHIGILKDVEPTIVPDLIGGEGLVLYPYTPMLTAEKVVMDYREGVNLLIRGIDLITEYSLYQHYCERFGYPQPHHIYLPRLRWSQGDMSKTAGSLTVAELRGNGYTPQQVKDMLIKACLISPCNGWTLTNLKAHPCL